MEQQVCKLLPSGEHAWAQQQPHNSSRSPFSHSARPLSQQLQKCAKRGLHLAALTPAYSCAPPSSHHASKAHIPRPALEPAAELLLSSHPANLHAPLSTTHYPRKHRRHVVMRTSSWDAWGSDSDDAEDELLATLTAKSQQAAAATRSMSSALHQKPTKSSTSSSSAQPSRLTQQPALPSPTTSPHLLFPFGPSASSPTTLPSLSSSPSKTGLQYPLRPELDAARGRAKPKPSSLFPKADPLIAQAYKGMSCTARYALTGEMFLRCLKDFNSVEFRPYSFTQRLRENMVAARFKVPTPIQKYALPAIAKGNDVLATSPTGTGKTAAYLLPLLGALMHTVRYGLPRNKAYPAMIILVPSRELVMQVQEECLALCRGSHLRVVGLHGGQPLATEVIAMRKGLAGGGADIVVTTPGRLLDHVERRRSIYLERLTHLVVDEADKLLDLGFEPELKRLMSSSRMPSQEMCQTVLFCASLPREVRDVAAKLLKPNFVHISVGLQSGAISLVSQNIVPFEQYTPHQEQPGTHPPLSPASSAEEVPSPSSTSPVPDGGHLWANKLSHLVSLSASEGLMLVFVNSIPQATKVFSALAELGHSVSLLHSRLPQASREEAIQCFRFGVTPIMVATGLAARGLNVPDITHVVNFDMPFDIHEYVYRIGRTGRAGRPGTSTSYLALPQDRWMARDLVTVLQEVKQVPPPWLVGLAQEEQLRGKVGRGRRYPMGLVQQLRQQQQGLERQEAGQKLGHERQQQQGQQPSLWLAALASKKQQQGVQREQRPSRKEQRQVQGGQALSGNNQQQQQQERQQQGEQSQGVEEGQQGAGERHWHSWPGRSQQPVSRTWAKSSTLVMESGDWSDAAFEPGSAGEEGGCEAARHGVHGPDGAKSLSSRNDRDSNNGSVHSASRSSNADTGGSTEDRLALLEQRRQLAQSKFNRYVRTWWGAGPQLSAVLDPLQQQLLQRHQQWWGGEGGVAADFQAAAGANKGKWKGGGASVAANGGLSPNSPQAPSSAAAGAADMSDEELLHQWSLVISQGTARLPSRELRANLGKPGAARDPARTQQHQTPVQPRSEKGDAMWHVKPESSQRVRQRQR